MNTRTKDLKGICRAPFVIATCLLTLTTASCTSEDDFANDNIESSLDSQSKEDLLSDFAKVLSKVTYQRKDVREFLKEQSIKQFDKNYDVLYAAVRDSLIGGESFRNILLQYVPETELAQIERNVPELNILVPNISFLGIHPEDMDCNDNEIPVAVSGESKNSLYLNGEIAENLEKGQVPDFHVFVVNENSRVKVSPMTRSEGATFSFIDPVFDGRCSESGIKKAPTRSVEMEKDSLIKYIGKKAIEAYSYFYKDDSSNYSMALQRDYIYYGMLPTSEKGYLNRSVTEYLSSIEVDPTIFTKISDDYGENEANPDPTIQNYTVSRKKYDYTPNELVNLMWTKGCYDIKVEIITSNTDTPAYHYLALRPEQIWNFSYDIHRRHKTKFRHSKYTYTIDPSKFTAKRYYLPNDITLGKWNLSEEAVSRIIRFTEMDKGKTITRNDKWSMVRTNTNKVNADVKLGLGLGADKDNISIGTGSENTSSTTYTVEKTLTTSYTDGDDQLGESTIYFYDPIIEGKEGNTYIVKTYNTGQVRFGLSVR